MLQSLFKTRWKKIKSVYNDWIDYICKVRSQDLDQKCLFSNIYSKYKNLSQTKTPVLIPFILFFYNSPK